MPSFSSLSTHYSSLFTSHCWDEKDGMCTAPLVPSVLWAHSSVTRSLVPQSLRCAGRSEREGIRDLRIYFCWLPALTSVTEGNDNISDNPWARLTSLSWPSASCPWSHRHEPGKDFHKWVLRFQLSVQPVTNDGGSHVATFGSNLMEFKS